MSIFRNTSDLNNCGVNRQEALLDVQRGVGEVDVLVLRLAGVDGLTQCRIALVRHAVANDVSFCHHAVTVWGSGSACVDVDSELFTLGVKFLATVCQRSRQGLRVASTGEARDAEGITMIDKLCSLVGGHYLAAQTGMCDAIRHVIS